MSRRDPVATKNLDGYGNPELPWSRARDALVAATGADVTWFLGTVRPDGRPHAAGVGATFEDGDLFFVSGPGARKARNLAANDACTISVHLPGIDLVFQGRAERVTDAPTLEGIAVKYRREGWPAEVEGDAFTAPFYAPSGGPPPWHLYRLRYDTVFGVAGEAPHGATRWRFEA